MILYRIFDALDFVCRALDFAVVLYCVLSWFRIGGLYEFLSRFLEPLLAPFRGMGEWVFRKTGLPINLTPLFAMLALELARSLIWKLYAFLI